MPSVRMVGEMVSALGMRLKALSREKGKMSRTPTMPHSSTWAHFGARFSTRRAKSTANTSQLAEILMFTTCKNSSVMAHSPF